MDVNDNFTQSVHQAQMDRIAELEALLDIAADTIAVNSPSDGIPTRESVIDDLRRVAARAKGGSGTLYPRSG